MYYLSNCFLKHKIEKNKFWSLLTVYYYYSVLSNLRAQGALHFHRARITTALPTRYKSIYIYSSVNFSQSDYFLYLNPFFHGLYMYEWISLWLFNADACHKLIERIAVTGTAFFFSFPSLSLSLFSCRIHIYRTVPCFQHPYLLLIKCFCFMIRAPRVSFSTMFLKKRKFQHIYSEQGIFRLFFPQTKPSLASPACWCLSF